MTLFDCWVITFIVKSSILSLGKIVIYIIFRINRIDMAFHRAAITLFIVHNLNLHEATILRPHKYPLFSSTPPGFSPFPPQPKLFTPRPIPIPGDPSISPTIETETDGKDHHCYRPCDDKPRECRYHFKVEWYYSMSKACYDCPFNITDCQRMDCVVADGLKRSITVVNRKMPGPAVEVCQNDKIIVDVENELQASGTTIHWHGMYQREHPYMDGTPFVTQCPIQPGNTFRYEFVAKQAGTYFWHSHIGLQRGDGVTGALIIRPVKAKDLHGKLYDFDKSEHSILITDWSDQLSIGMFTDHYHSSSPTSPTSLLINGVGRFEVQNSNNTVITKTKTFNVVQGKRYRFRLINGEFLNCPVELSVDGHNITVIATDGSDLEPVTATSLVTYSGERFDFIISANNEVDNYWIRIRGLLGCAEGANPVRQVAVLHYEGAKGDEPSELQWDVLPRDGLQINPVNQAEEQNVTVPISRLKSLRGPDESLKSVPDYKFYISYDLYAKSNTHYNKLPYYGYNQVKPEFRARTPQLNHISMKLPTSPLLYTEVPEYLFCNESSVKESCKEEYCQCPHVLKVKLNSTVEVIIIDEGAAFDTNHPFHLHGYSFRVVGQRKLDSATTVDKVKEFENSGQMTRNLENPPFKDTVTVPDGGYSIIRFKADNPGYWLFHCHIEFHAEVGMSLVFKVGEHIDMVRVPADFPSCGDFKNSALETIRRSVMKVIPDEGIDLPIR